jgi:hypothetical protein
MQQIILIISSNKYLKNFMLIYIEPHDHIIKHVYIVCMYRGPFIYLLYMR